MIERKGIILAGGLGTRLYPITKVFSKQLLPIYNKPMIYYPIATLMLAGIRNILIITTPQDKDLFQKLLGNGKQWGIDISFEVQYKPDGLAQSFIIGEDFLDRSPSTLILGDNLFIGKDLKELFHDIDKDKPGASIFGYEVSDPERYGVIELDDKDNIKRIVEKPSRPLSNFAITGLYFLDETASDRAKKIKKSERGELEIVSLLETYLDDGLLNMKNISDLCKWYDTGTHDSLLDSGNFIRKLSEQTGSDMFSLEKISKERGFIKP